MKYLFNIRIVTLFFFIAFGANIAQAETSANDSLATQNANDLKLVIGGELMHLDYKETLEMPKKSTESGWLPGLYGEMRRNFVNELAIGGNGSIFFGNENYDGSTQDGVPVTGTTKSIFLNMAAFGSKTFALADNADLEVRVGVSLKFWRRELGENYVEDYMRYAVPIQVNLPLRIDGQNRIVFSAAADIMFYGTMSLDFYGSNGTFKLGNEPGIRAGLAYESMLSPTLKLILGGGYEHFTFGQSDYKYMILDGQPSTVLEPASKTTNYYLRLGFELVI